MEAPIIMTEEVWRNSPMSIARFYGGLSCNGYEYKIVNKDGITLQELSDPADSHFVKSGMAIKPGEPADLVREDWLGVYKKLGRDKTIELVKRNVSIKEAKRIAKEAGVRKDNHRKK